jgi:PKD repeat protein
MLSKRITGTLIMLAIATLIIPVSAFTFSAGDATVNGIGSTATVNLVLDEAPTGLAGFNVTVSLADPGVAEIMSVSYPAWVSQYDNSSLPADTVWIKTVDMGAGENGTIAPGAVNIPMGTLTLRGDAAGTTAVTVTINQMSDDLGSNMFPSIVPGSFTVNIPPVAQFDANQTSGNAPLTVLFTDQSTGSPTSWSWSFGDGGTSTEQDPVYTYTSAGTYTVTLTATNAGGSDSEVKTGFISVNALPGAPVAAFTATPTSGTSPLAVQFTDQSTGSPTSWAWDFGDGNTSTVQSPAHTYSASGTYTVNLVASNAGGSDGEQKTGYIRVYDAGAIVLIITPQTANVPVGSVQTYTFTVNSLMDGLSGSNVTVALSDPSIGEITSLSLPAWAVLNDTTPLPADEVAFGGVDLGQQVQNETTNVPLGTITVRADTGGVTTLVVAVPGLDDDHGFPIPIVVSNAELTTYQAVVANFTADITTSNVPFTVTFTDLSTGDPAPTSRAWDFDGDGSTDSTVMNPTHEYTVPGRYNVSLTATGPYNQDTMTRTYYIVATRNVEPFPGHILVPTDPDFDGLYEDTNGNGIMDFDDVVVFYKNMAWVRNNTAVGIAPYDFNGNGLIDYDDVVQLFLEVVHSG